MEKYADRFSTEPLQPEVVPQDEWARHTQGDMSRKDNRLQLSKHFDVK